MTDDDRARQATPRQQLLDELLDPRVPKTEREHASAREIERLRDYIGAMVSNAADQRLNGYRELGARAAAAENERDALRDHLARIKRAVSAQADDEGLWFQAMTAPEAALQQALRQLHAIVEGEQ